MAFSGVQFEVAELPERETPRCQLPPFCVSTFGDGLLNHLDQNGWEKKNCFWDLVQSIGNVSIRKNNLT